MSKPKSFVLIGERLVNIKNMQSAIIEKVCKCGFNRSCVCEDEDEDNVVHYSVLIIYEKREDLKLFPLKIPCESYEEAIDILHKLEH